MSQLLRANPLALREKLLTHGAEQLSDCELLAVFISSGNKNRSCLQLAQELMQKIGDLRAILNANTNQFREISGLGLVKYLQLQAAREICRRSDYISLQKDTRLTNSQQTHQFIKRKLRDKKNETFAALFLDSQYRVIHFSELFHGSINSASVYARPLIEKVLQYNAAALIIAHNHPSGVAQASEEDYQITAHLQKAMALIEVQLLDHLVVGDNEIFSILGQYRQSCQ